MKTIGTYLTVEGSSKLREKLDWLCSDKRREVADKLKRAIEIGGTANNSEYEEAKREQSSLETSIRQTQKLLKDAILIPKNTDPIESVQIGGTVTIVDSSEIETQYIIVGSAEADPIQGKLSNESPVGNALLGKRIGERITVKTPAGPREFTVKYLK